jgi:NADH-quinone oxidoreductase subunit E
LAKNILTDDNFRQLHEVIEHHRHIQGSLMPILNEAQSIFGAIPYEVQKTISDALNIPLAEIYGVVTFYSQFTLEPKGQYLISVCLGTACYVKGSQKILDQIVTRIGVGVGQTSANGHYSVEATRCIGACGLAPVMTINDAVYGRLVEGDIAGILEKYSQALEEASA